MCKDEQHFLHMLPALQVGRADHIMAATARSAMHELQGDPSPEYLEIVMRAHMRYS